MSATVTAADIAAARARLPGGFRAPPRVQTLRWAIGLAAVGYLAYLHWLFGFGRLFDSLGRLGVILRLMADWSRFATWDHIAIWSSMIETLAMAFLGTALASIVAVPLGFLGARNVIPGRLFRFLTRRVFDGLRGLDQLVWALVFVRAVGLGPTAGILAIIASDTGVLAKLYSESIEASGPGQVEGVRSTGASAVAALRFGLLPQVLPVMLSQALYQFESNTREATILGLVGAGGIGLRLSERIQINAWDQVAYIIVLLVGVVGLIDTVSRMVRMRLIGGPASARQKSLDNAAVVR